MNVFDWLIEWYKSNCNGSWEHHNGIKIDTLDNPGWVILINLTDTKLKDKNFQKIEIDNGNDDWITCKIKDNVFEAYCDSNKLISAIEIFKHWAEK